MLVFGSPLAVGISVVPILISVGLGALVYEVVRRFTAAAPAYLGWIRLTHLRAVLAGVFTLTAGVALTLSVSDHTHHAITYVCWYGIASVALCGILVTTFIIEQGSARLARASSAPELVDVEHRNQIRDIFTRCSSLVGLGLPYTWGDELRRSIAAAHNPDLVPQVEEWNHIATRPRAARDALRARIGRELEALSLEGQFNVPAITDGFLAYTEGRALQGQLSTPMARERIWAVYRPTHGPPDGAHLRGLHEIAIGLDNRISEPAYTSIALGLIERVMPVFEAAQQWPEAQALPEARDAMRAYDKTPILREIERVVARARIAIAANCPVCGEIG